MAYKVREKYIMPQQGFLKLNYDGASKGNPIQAGAGGICWDFRGQFKRIYAIELGYASNNEVEITAVKHTHNCKQRTIP